jgi:hypothetical protein
MTIAVMLLALAAPQDAELDFFEKRIRPILADKCYSCHAVEAKKLKGNLHLDSLEGMLKGGDLGPALVPGDPKKSLLIQAVHWEEDLKMPPKKKLSEAEILDLEAWVKRGAVAPKDSPAAAKKPAKQVGLSVEEGRRFWSYRPPVAPPVPAVKDAAWPRDDVDRFLLARLESAGLRPAPEAPREVLLRRLHYDLVGLPPRPEELDAFLADAAPDAWERRVDALLASRAFAERWARHWLDVARYAESLTLRGFILKEAWRYRDYVIDSFHRDRPYPEFIREQIAGPLLPSASLEERRRRQVAQSFLAIGNHNLEEQDKKQLEMDVIDEQIETLGRTLLGQTLACARCHDHKFDPIPTRDYYAIAGILKNVKLLEHDNVSRWLEDPLPEEPARETELRAHEDRVAVLEGRLKELKGQAAVAARQKAAAAKGVLAVSEVPGIVIDDAQAVPVGDWKNSTFSGVYIGAGYRHDVDQGKGERSLTFQPELPAGRYEVRFAYSPGSNRAPKVPVTILSAEGETTIHVNQQQVPPVDGRFVVLGQFRFEQNQGYVLVSNADTKGHVTADAVAFLPVGGAGTAAAPAVADAAEVKKLEEEIKKLKESGPKRDRAMGVREQREIKDLRIHLRGLVTNLGEVAPRGVLQVALDGAAPVMPADQSGRLQLADWIASPGNPLTDRVWVNRVWHWIFGVGLVRTTDNFGTTGETPSHPELLDHLAVEFRKDGSSLKRLVRRLVTSAAYRMSSAAPASAAPSDPENRLLWRMNRRRMEAEVLRDTLLAVSGRLRVDLEGGPTWPASLNSDYAYRHASTERSVYVPVFRNSLPEIFDAFDFADPSMPTGRRNASTVAPQALFMLNNPFVREQAAAAARALPPGDARVRVERAWRLALGRAPSEGEAGAALKAAAGGGEAAWTVLFQALFASIDFRFVD